MDLVHLWQPDGPSCKTPPKGVSEARAGHTLEGKCFHWCENQENKRIHRPKMKPTKASKSWAFFPLPVSDSSLNPSFNLTYCLKLSLNHVPGVRINHQLPPWASDTPALRHGSSLSQGESSLHKYVSPPFVVTLGQGPDPTYPRIPMSPEQRWLTSPGESEKSEENCL